MDEQTKELLISHKNLRRYMFKCKINPGDMDEMTRLYKDREQRLDKFMVQHFEEIADVEDLAHKDFYQTVRAQLGNKAEYF